jgi:hypothetical protein
MKFLIQSTKWLLLTFITSSLGFALSRRAATLTHRAETTTVDLVVGNYTPYQNGYLGKPHGQYSELPKLISLNVAGKWELFSNGQYVTLKGVGYIRVRWEVEYWQ